MKAMVEQSSFVPLVLMFIAGSVDVTRFRQRILKNTSSSSLSWLSSLIDIVLLIDIIWTTFLWYMILRPSIIPFWIPLTYHISRLWPKLFSSTSTREDKQSWISLSIQWLIHGGPLGTGCSKFIEVVVAFVLWRIVHNRNDADDSSDPSAATTASSWPNLIQIIFGSTVPSWYVWIGVMILSLGVNIVLQLWSTIMNSHGTHGGVNDMVESTHGRSLTWNEQIQIFLLALINATCEEITARWFWRNEFFNILHYIYYGTNNNANSSTIFAVGSSSHQKFLLLSSNISQAIIFGIKHYYGIPSGIAGVLLTFVYGFIMGLLADYFGNGNLLLPIITHTIADYFIFTTIVRQRKKKKQ